MSNPNYKNASKHKANHGNYYHKPTQKDVRALNSLYAGIDEISKVVNKTVRIEAGAQFKLKF